MVQIVVVDRFNGGHAMTDTATAALYTAAGSMVVALISSGFGVWTSRKTSNNSVQIEGLKGAVGRDLERLKAKLSHGQLISSTQWQVEFSAYQAIWKEIVAVRTSANKLVYREGELSTLGMPPEYLASVERTPIRRNVMEVFIAALRDLLLAIHENAPFYPEHIRIAANSAHLAARDLFTMSMKAFTHAAAAGNDLVLDPRFTEQSAALLLVISQHIDHVEDLIRKRLAAVQIVNTASVID